MAMDIEKIEEGDQKQHNKGKEDDLEMSIAAKRWLIFISGSFNIIGTIGGPMLLKIYFLHGGTRNWIASWLQAAGFPILLLPLTILYFRDRKHGVQARASTNLLTWSVGIGLISGFISFLYSYGSSYLPVSTSQILLSTQLAFTAFFSYFIVKQKFTSYMINAIVVLTMGPILIGLKKDGDQPPSVTRGEYLLGFVLTLGVSALFGLTFTCTEFAYTKTSKAITCSGMLQFVFGMNSMSAVVCSIAMLINKDFAAIPREASEFELGATKYYVILILSAIVWQLAVLGTFGLICWTSSIFVGVFGAAMLPFTEIVAAIVFHEKFTGEKGMALALCLWGFTSYFYGSYKESKKNEQSNLEIEHK